jgi:hypothetical protein
MCGCSDPWSHESNPEIRGALVVLVVTSAVPAVNGMISGPKVRPPSVDRRIRTSPSVPPPADVFVCQATQTSPLGAVATSDGQVNPSPVPEMLPASVVQVAPWLVERASRTGALDRPKSCQTTYRLLANGLDGLSSAAIHSLSRFPWATRTGPPTVAPVVGLTCCTVTLTPLLVPGPVR